MEIALQVPAPSPTTAMEYLAEYVQGQVSLLMMLMTIVLRLC